MSRFVPLVTALLVLSVGCGSPPSLLGAGPTAAFITTSGPMPAVSGPGLTGGAIGPTTYRGKVVVVNFWNYDCPPCKAEQPLLQSVWDHLRGRGVVVLGVMYVGGNWPGDPAAARDYLREHGVTYPTLMDGGSELAQALGIVGIPTTIVADRSGHLRDKIVGQVHGDELETLVARLAG